MSKGKEQPARRDLACGKARISRDIQPLEPKVIKSKIEENYGIKILCGNKKHDSCI